MSVLALLTGGTIGLRAVAGGDGMERVDVAREVLPSVVPGAATVAVASEVVAPRSGAALTLRTILAVRDRILAERGNRVGFLVTTGTDALEELAYALDLLLPPEIPVAVTGAAKPLHIDGYDGRANCADALRVLTAAALQPWTLGVVVVLGETVHAARYVRKADSALQGGMFVSHPGPLAQVRSGAVRVYIPALPPLDRIPPDLHIDPGVAVPRVDIWTMAADVYPPSDAYLATLDGLVVAGMGTGSISDEVADALARHVQARALVVVLVSRVGVGLNHDEHYYHGSVAKYERLGFHVRGGYEALNAYQARLKLLLRIISS